MENETRINIPKIKINIDDIIENAALARVKQLELKMDNIIICLSVVSSGENLFKYWKKEDELIKDVIKAYENFNKTSNKANATELLKIVNALKAVHGVEISDVIPDFNIVEAGIESAKEITHLDSAYSIPTFRTVFDAFETLEIYGADLYFLFNCFERSLKTYKLEEELSNANKRIANLTKKITQLEEKLKNS